MQAGPKFNSTAGELGPLSPAELTLGEKPYLSKFPDFLWGLTARTMTLPLVLVNAFYLRLGFAVRDSKIRVLYMHKERGKVPHRYNFNAMSSSVLAFCIYQVLTLKFSDLVVMYYGPDPGNHLAICFLFTMTSLGLLQRLKCHEYINCFPGLGPRLCSSTQPRSSFTNIWAWKELHLFHLQYLWDLNRCLIKPNPSHDFNLLSLN